MDTVDISNLPVHTNHMTSIRNQPWFSTIYRIGVGIKGVDGLIELAAGLFLLFAPHVLHAFLQGIVGKAELHHTHMSHLIATYVAHADADLARSGLVFLIVFLIGHGVVKLALVYCLLRRIIWAYPYALAILGLFLVYQVYALVQNPLSLGTWLFTILDVIIIYLVWGEWKDLKEKHPAHG